VFVAILSVHPFCDSGKKKHSLNNDVIAML